MLLQPDCELVDLWCLTHDGKLNRHVPQGGQELIYISEANQFCTF